MTDKRFIPIFDGTDKRVVGAKDNGKIISFMDMFDLLNELHDENEKLKIFLKAVNEELSLANRDYDTLEEEYEELKQHNTELIKKIDMLERIIDGDV